MIKKLTKENGYGKKTCLNCTQTYWTALSFCDHCGNRLTPVGEMK